MQHILDALLDYHSEIEKSSFLSFLTWHLLTLQQNRGRSWKRSCPMLWRNTRKWTWRPRRLLFKPNTKSVSSVYVCACVYVWWGELLWTDYRYFLWVLTWGCHLWVCSRMVFFEWCINVNNYRYHMLRFPLWSLKPVLYKHDWKFIWILIILYTIRCSRVFLVFFKQKVHFIKQYNIVCT